MWFHICHNGIGQNCIGKNTLQLYRGYHYFIQDCGIIFQHHLANIEEVKQAMEGSLKDDAEFRILSSHNPKDFNINLLLLYVKGTSMSDKTYKLLYGFKCRHIQSCSRINLKLKLAHSRSSEHSLICIVLKGIPIV